MRNIILNSLAAMTLISLNLGCHKSAVVESKVITIPKAEQYTAKEKEIIYEETMADGLISPDFVPAMSKSASSKCEIFKTRIPENWVQNTISVPEDYSNPSSEKIEIFYYHRHLKSTDIPVVFFNGGPFSNSWGSSTLLSQALGFYSEWENINFIYIDQRGTGCSSKAPSGVTKLALQRQSLYGSNEIVLDAEEVRKIILGNKPWKVFGQSYGAHIAHRYSILRPESVISFHAHGNAITATAEERFEMRIKSQLRVLNYYLESYPTDQNRLKVLFNTFNKDYCLSQNDFAVCGHEILETFNFEMGFVRKWPDIHKWLVLLVPKDKVEELGLKDFAKKNIFITPDTSLPNSISSVIGYVDRGIQLPDFKSCNQVITKMKIEKMNVNDFTIHECLSVLQRGPQTEQKINLSFLKQKIMTIPQFKKSLLAHQKPFYLYSGEKDPYTPKEYFKQEVSQLGSLVNYTHFLDSGHDGYYSEPQVFQDLLK